MSLLVSADEMTQKDVVEAVVVTVVDTEEEVMVVKDPNFKNSNLFSNFNKL